jgi:hypothetical protein
MTPTAPPRARSHERKVTILCNQQAQCDRTIPNKPDIIIRDNDKGTCLLIRTSIAGDRNVIKKEAENIFKTERPHKRNNLNEK